MFERVQITVISLLVAACSEPPSRGARSSEASAPSTADPKTLDDFQAISSRHRSADALATVRLPPDQRERLSADWTSNPDELLLLEGVSSLSAEQGAELARFTGSAIILDDLKSLDAPAAAALAKWPGKLLALGSARVAPGAASELAKFSGVVAISMTPNRGPPTMDARQRAALAALSKAIVSGDAAAIRGHLDSGGSPDLNERGTSLLMEAAYFKRVEIVELLVEAGADVRARNHDDLDGLHHAMSEPVLRDEPVDPRAVLAIVRLLVDAGAPVNVRRSKSLMYEAPLAQAAAGGWLDVVDLLLAEGADARATDDAGRTALIAAINAGHPLIVERLVEAGAVVDVDSPGPGQSPIHRAIQAGSIEIEMYLYEASQPGRALDPKALAAIESRRLATLEAVIEAGANMEATDGDGRTPLCTAINAGVPKVVEAVLDAGARLDRADSEGDTPLHFLARVSRLDESDLVPVAKLLVARGAARNARNEAGRTPADLARERERPALAKALREGGP